MKAKFRAMEKVVTTRVVPAIPPLPSESKGVIVQVTRPRGQSARYQVDFLNTRLWIDEDTLEARHWDFA